MFEKLEETVKAICQKCDVRLYDIDVINIQKGAMLRVYITKARAVSIEDCSRVAKELNILIRDEDPLLKDFLNVEVSSPGIDRVLKFKKHYASSLGETIRVSYVNEGNKEILIGKLKEVKSDTIIVESGGKMTPIPFQSIKKAKTCGESK